jgi:hypothetical protein
MPIEPKGTRPISTLRRLSNSHSSAPRPVPTENSASIRVYTGVAPPITSRT